MLQQYRSPTLIVLQYIGLRACTAVCFQYLLLLLRSSFAVFLFTEGSQHARNRP